MERNKNVSGSTHSIKPLQNWRNYDANKKNLKENEKFELLPIEIPSEIQIPPVTHSYTDFEKSYIELSNNTPPISITNADLNNLNNNSLNTVMTNRGYNYRFDISRIVIGRNIKEITSTNNGGDGAINITNNFSIIFLPRENSSDSIKLKRYAFSGCRGLKDISFTNYMEIETNSLAGIGITYLDLSPILNYNIINHQTITGLSIFKICKFW